MNDDKKSLISDFTEGNVTKQLLVFALPMFLSSLLQIVYGMVDMVIVGRAMGKVGLSAVSVGGDISGFLTFIAFGFSSAGQILISQYIGAGHKKVLGRFIGTLGSFHIVIAAVLSVVCLLFQENILHLMNTPPESYEQARNYAVICIAGLVFIYGYNVVSAILRGMGDAKHPFIFISLAAVLNIILDLLFVLKFGLGAGGAALATVISQGISFISCTVFIYRHRKQFELTFSLRDFIHPDRIMFSKLMKLGIPMAIKAASVRTSKLFVNAWINSYGVAVSAFAGIANNFGQTTNLLSNAFNTAGASMAGQNFGAQKYDRVVKIMKSVFGITFITASFLTAVMLIAPNAVYGIFTKDPEVIEVGSRYVPIAIMLFYGSCARAGMNALINGSGNMKVNFACAILDGIVCRIGFAALFGLALGMKHYGFWLGDALAGFTPFWLGLIFYHSGKWKQRVV